MVLALLPALPELVSLVASPVLVELVIANNEDSKESESEEDPWRWRVVMVSFPIQLNRRWWRCNFRGDDNPIDDKAYPINDLVTSFIFVIDDVVDIKLEDDDTVPNHEDLVLETYEAIPDDVGE